MRVLQFIAITSLVVFVLYSSPVSSDSGHVDVICSELEVRLVETIYASNLF